MKDVGLALAGGGIVGGIYHVGVLSALEHALDGLEFTQVRQLVGVSAGAIIASCIANGISPSELARNLVDPKADEPVFKPEIFFTPAYDKYASKTMDLPRVLLDAFKEVISPGKDQSFLKGVLRFSRLIPGGLFSNQPIRNFLEELFAFKGRTNDFRELKTQLNIVATDLDSAKSVIFGSGEMAGIPISEAVQASSALPGIFPPVEINGRSYVDGALIKTMHASIALKAGCPLVIGVNPIVPVDTSKAVELGIMRRGKLVNRGLPGILSQTFRTIIHSRMTVGFSAYKERYPESDTVLFEPSQEDYTMFFTNVLSFSSRKKVCDHAYRQALKQLVKRREELEPVFNRHGIYYRNGFLKDTDRSIWDEVIPNRKSPGKKLEHVLQRLESRIESLSRGERAS